MRDGGFLLQMAAHYPERRFLGIERLLGRVRGVCSRAASRRLDNVKVCRVESRYFLEWRYGGLDFQAALFVSGPLAEGEAP